MWLPIALTVTLMTVIGVPFLGLLFGLFWEDVLGKEFK